MDKSKLSAKQLFAAIVCGISYTGCCGVSYIINYYYSMYQQATGFTDGQIGSILSAIGSIAVLSYLVGGVLADKFRPKVLLMFSMISTSICSLIMITYPAYEIMLPVQLILGICALLPYWCPLAKFITATGKTPEQTNKIWGIYTAVVGASGFLVGLICTAILNTFDARMGMTVMVIMYVAMMAFTAVMLPVLDKSKKGEGIDKSNSFKFSYILKLLAMPKVWMVFIAITCLYLTAFVFTYITPMLSNVFMVPLATVTLISTVRANLLKVVTGPAAGTMAAKLHTSHKGLAVLYVIAIIGMALLLVIPWGPDSVILALVCVILLACAYSASTTYWTPNVYDAGIPEQYLGTAVGFSSVFMTIPDMFVYTLAGNAIEKHGESAYKTIFAIVLGLYVVGLIMTLLVIRLRVKENAESK